MLAHGVSGSVDPLSCVQYDGVHTTAGASLGAWREGSNRRVKGGVSFKMECESMKKKAKLSQSLGAQS